MQVSGVEVQSKRCSGFKITPCFAYFKQLYPCCENIVFRHIIQSFVLSVTKYFIQGIILTQLSFMTFKSRKENPQTLTQLSSRSHQRHLVGKGTAQKSPKNQSRRAALGRPAIKITGGLCRPQTSSSPPVIFIAGRPKAALLFWFFGDFRCGALLFMVIHVIYKYKNR